VRRDSRTVWPVAPKAPSRHRPAMSRLESHRRRPVWSLEYRWQRQLHLEHRCVMSGIQHHAGNFGDQFSPGLERRWGDRLLWHRDRVAWIDQPGRGVNNYFLIIIAPDLALTEICRRRRCSGSVCAVAPLGVEQTSTGYEVAWKVHRRRSVWGLEYRWQRQLHLNIGGVMSDPARAGNSGDQLPSGFERRWRDRCVLPLQAQRRRRIRRRRHSAVRR